ncbi:MAG: Type 1 glutamine amidotransferase-like domain-containing protein, partial [Nanoarchaeota archaeon]|nr:Type 1 glutamine amidotransferase-like domain-containing protein [Nanoarchaeota archaeon]
KNIIKNLKNFNGIIFGGSAGALVQCKKYIAIKKPEPDRKITKPRSGIGLTDIMISVHYGSKNPMLAGENPDIELKNFSKKHNKKIYAIPERSAIEYNNGKLKFHGNIYLFNKGIKTKI